MTTIVNLENYIFKPSIDAKTGWQYKGFGFIVEDQGFAFNPNGSPIRYRTKRQAKEMLDHIYTGNLKFPHLDFVKK